MSREEQDAEMKDAREASEDKAVQSEKDKTVQPKESSGRTKDEAEHSIEEGR